MERINKVLSHININNNININNTSAEDVTSINNRINNIEKWFKSERFANTIRNYTPADVERLRLPHFNTVYESNYTAKKLWKLLKEYQKNKQYSHTFGALDTVQVIQMAKYLSSVYVSGWQCSSTASTTNEPGPDLADYPYTTVPDKVEQLFKAQLFHSRRQHEERSHWTPEKRQAIPPIDFLRPIIADGDTGHGGLTAVMKLCKLMAEKGAAGVHFEDQKPVFFYLNNNFQF